MTTTTTDKPQYAYLFPEGEGYLMVQRLGSGTQGDACLVKSIADGKIYVRKMTEETSGPIDQIHNREVRFYRPYALIPTLIDWEDYKVRERDDPEYHNVQRNVMFSQFCNGGNLRQIFRYYTYNTREGYVPEILIWKCLLNFIQILGHIHHRCIPAIIHGDIVLTNVFVHWPESSRLPDFYLGDFGHAESIDIRNGIELDANSTDLSGLGNCLKLLVYGDEETNPNAHSAAYAEVIRQTYSEELLECVDGVDGFRSLRFLDTSDAYFHSLGQLESRVTEIMKSMEDSDQVPALQNPFRYDHEVMVFDSVPELLQCEDFPSAPWKIAVLWQDRVEAL